MKKAILLPMLCLIALCGCEKSTELSEITGNPETETPENGSLTFLYFVQSYRFHVGHLQSV